MSVWRYAYNQDGKREAIVADFGLSVRCRQTAPKPLLTGIDLFCCECGGCGVCTFRRSPLE